MGVEYCHFLVPKERTFVPDAERIARLVGALRRERYVYSPELPEDPSNYLAGVVPGHLATGGYAIGAAPGVEPPRLLRIEERAAVIPHPLDADWPPLRVDEELALVFPVNSDSWEDESLPRYPFLLDEDEGGYHDIVVYRAKDYLRRDPRVATCVCGADLAFVRGGYLHSAVREERVRATCPACGAAFTPGGDTYRFAILVDCGKGWPRSRDPIEIDPAFVAACEQALGTKLDSFGEVS